MLPNTAAELTRSYSDMRFELNKLSTLRHPYVVKFIGVLTNPHSFVLEWAPLKSLEHIRQNYAHQKERFCPTSISKVLMQVNYNKFMCGAGGNVSGVRLEHIPCTYRAFVYERLCHAWGCGYRCASWIEAFEVPITIWQLGAHKGQFSRFGCSSLTSGLDLDLKSGDFVPSNCDYATWQ